MGNKIRKTIYLPKALAIETETLARAEGKSLSDVIGDALRESRSGSLPEFLSIISRIAQPPF